MIQVSIPDAMSLKKFDYNAEDERQALYRATKSNQVDYAAEYGEFLYQAGSWSHTRPSSFIAAGAEWRTSFQ